MKGLRVNSLFFRLLAASVLWTTLALVVTGFVLSSNFRSNAEESFRELLIAHSYNLMGSVGRNEDGKITGSPDLGDPRFVSPLSGWYWSVANAARPGEPLIASRSMASDRLTIPEPDKQPFDDRYRRYYELEDFNGQSIGVLEAQLLVDESDELVQVMVSGNRAVLVESIAEFDRSLVFFFGLFGLGMVLATAAIIHFGLRPLRQARDDLSAVREGGAEKLEGDYPAEIEPLANEVNALLASNRAVVERARVQVGNLAHALKTPLAVLRNEAAGKGSGLRDLVGQQSQAMQLQIDTYLNRARIAALKGTISARTPVKPLVERLVRVIGKLNGDIEVTVSGTIDAATGFGGEAQDLEEILGNLLENAARFAKSEVEMSVAGNNGHLRLYVDDDGPGLSPEERQKVLGRGVRLDESSPGSGLGLSIVRDIVQEYEGEFSLDESPLGGLRATLILPYVRLRQEP